MWPPEVRTIALALTSDESDNWRISGRTKPFSDRETEQLLGLGRGIIAIWRRNSGNTSAAISERLSTVGRKRKLTDRQEHSVMGWAKQQRKKKKVVKARQIIGRVKAVNGGISISPSKVTHLAQEHRMSSQRTKRRSADKNTLEFDERVASFRATFQRERVAAKHTLVMDEAGVYDNDIHPYCYDDVGSGGAEVEVPVTGQRDTVVATLRGDGVALPPFYIHHQRANKRNGIAAVKGMNSKIMLE
jgi:hypothetical protein